MLFLGVLCVGTYSSGHCLKISWGGIFLSVYKTALVLFGLNCFDQLSKVLKSWFIKHSISTMLFDEYCKELSSAKSLHIDNICQKHHSHKLKKVRDQVEALGVHQHWLFFLKTINFCTLLFVFISDK